MNRIAALCFTTRLGTGECCKLRVRNTGSIGQSLSSHLLHIGLSPQRFLRQLPPNYSVKWTAAMSRGNLTLAVVAATYLKR